LSFVDSEWQDGISDATIARTIARGQPPTMPAFAELLTSQQIGELVKHVRTLRPRSE
jgi:mono/diheme cytochrome c family protein